MAGRGRAVPAAVVRPARGHNVLLVDDWVTTGSSARVIRSTIEDLGASYVGAAVLVNKARQDVLADLGVHWLVDFEEVGRRVEGAQ